MDARDKLLRNAHAMLARAVERRDWAQVEVVLRGLERHTLTGSASTTSGGGLGLHEAHASAESTTKSSSSRQSQLW